MSPQLIARKLSERKINIAALTDHNSARNCPAFATACQKEGIIPLFGIEVQVQEECHIVCLFADLQTAVSFGDEIYDTLPPILNKPEKTGDQVWVDDNEDIAGSLEIFLVNSSSYTLDELTARVHALGGLVIPAHVDRPSFSLSSQFGLIPDGNWDALELTRLPGDSITPVYSFTPPLPDTGGYPLITSSDAHYPEHIGKKAFDLDIGDLPLYTESLMVNLDTIKAALARRPRMSQLDRDNPVQT